MRAQAHTDRIAISKETYIYILFPCAKKVPQISNFRSLCLQGTQTLYKNCLNLNNTNPF
jgi:hypothetical protein